MGIVSAAKSAGKSLVNKAPMVTAVEAPGNEATMRGALKSVTTDAAASRAHATASTAIPKMHSGGPVATDGVYQLKAGEHVLTEPEAKIAKKHAMMMTGLKSLAKDGKKK